MTSQTRRKIRIGVVGCGVVATAYYLPYLMRMKDAEFTAACDIYSERTAACARLFGAKETYADYDEMIRHADIEAVLILTGPGTHADFTLKALETGRHVLLQKPMALTMRDARTIAEAARRLKKVVLVEPSENSLLDPDIATLRGLIERGVLGRPYWFSHMEWKPESDHPSLGGNPYGMGAFYSEDSGGVLFDFPYGPNLIVSLLGACKSVTGLAKLSVPERFIVPEGEYDRFINQVTDPERANYWERVVDLPRNQEIRMGAPDNVFSLYEMTDGFTGVFQVGRPFLPSLPGTGAGGLQIYGSEGNLNTGGGYRASIITRHKNLLPEVSQDGWFHLPARGDHSLAKWPIPTPGAFNYYHQSLQHFVDCICEDRDPVVNVEWGLHITEMMVGAIESSKTGKRYEMTTTV